MDVALLLKSIMGLVSILAVLMFLLFRSSSKKKIKKVKIVKKKVKPTVKKPLNTDLKFLKTIIKKKQTEAPKLQ